MTGEELLQHISNVKKWELRKGKNELLRHLEGGKPLTLKQAITAKCYECNAGFPDGTGDCGIIICPLHDFMPFREGGVRKTRVGKPLTEEQKAKMGEGKGGK